MHRFTIRKTGRLWRIAGLAGMTAEELNNAAEQILSEKGLDGDTVLQIGTRKGVEEWSIADFSNASARQSLVQRL